MNFFRRALDCKVAGKLDRHPSGTFHVLCSHLNRLQNILVPGAAARVSRNRFAHVVVSWLLVPGQQLQSRKHQPRRAVPALQSVAIAKSFLDRMQLAIFFQALDGENLHPVRLHREHGA